MGRIGTSYKNAKHLTRHVPAIFLCIYSYHLRCADTDYLTPGKSCGEVCGELLGCGKHYCDKQCHAGLCPPCQVTEAQACYCGKETREAKCGSGKPIMSGAKDSNIGFYACDNICER